VPRSNPAKPTKTTKTITKKATQPVRRATQKEPVAARGASSKIVARLRNLKSQDEQRSVDEENETPLLPLSDMHSPPEEPLNRAGVVARARDWMKELVSLRHLKNDGDLLLPKEVYYSTSIGDFAKVATWAQWYGVHLASDLTNIDRARFVLLAIEQHREGARFCYGLLQRDNGRIRHLFDLEVDKVPVRMREQGLSIPDWFDVLDLDHYRVG
jgi:hypothetical protein